MWRALESRGCMHVRARSSRCVRDGGDASGNGCSGWLHGAGRTLVAK